MGAKKTRRISVRVAERGDDYIRLEAARVDVTPSHMVRRMLAFARLNMPRGWVPPRDADRAPREREGT